MGLLTIIRKNRLKEKEMRCLFLGLDNAGKTTILKSLNHQPIDTISPTLGFTISTFLYQSYTLTIWDVGGQTSLRPYWRNYFEMTDAVVWVVDSSDRQRGMVNGEGKKELWSLLKEERLAGATLLIFANKQDLQGSMTVEEISEALDLPSLRSHTYHIQPCSAYTGENLVKGLDWLVREVAGRVYYGSQVEDKGVREEEGETPGDKEREGEVKEGGDRTTGEAGMREGSTERPGPSDDSIEEILVRPGTTFLGGTAAPPPSNAIDSTSPLPPSAASTRLTPNSGRSSSYLTSAPNASIIPSRTSLASAPVSYPSMASTSTARARSSQISGVSPTASRPNSNGIQSSSSAPISTRQQLPPHKIQERGSSRKLTIGDWVIETVKKPILSSKELDKVAETIDIPLPEITFGNNALTLTHAPSGTSARAGSALNPISLGFSALSALGQVADGEGWEERIGGGVHVAAAEQWNKTRVSQPAYLSDTPIPSQPIKPFDWTYSTVFAGDVTPGHSFESSSESIPMDLLARQDPVLDQIIFYDDVPLFEDELHDNGESIMNVRIRVMPHSFFILLRLLVRVDNVLFRQHDVRVYHAFGSDRILREVTGKEVRYDEVKNRLESKEDMMPLTNPNWVVQQMSTLRSRSLSQAGKAWPGLDGRREILRMDALHGIREGLERTQL